MSHRRFHRIIERLGISRYLHMQILALGAGGVLAVGLLVLGLDTVYGRVHARVGYTSDLFTTSRPLIKLLTDERVAELNYSAVGGEKYILQRERFKKSIRSVLEALRTGIDVSDQEILAQLVDVETASFRRDTAFQGLVEIKRDIGVGNGAPGRKTAFDRAVQQLDGLFQVADDAVQVQIKGAVFSAAAYVADHQPSDLLKFTQFRLKFEELVQNSAHRAGASGDLKSAFGSFSEAFGKLVWAHDKARSQDELLARAYEDQNRSLDAFMSTLKAEGDEAEVVSRSSMRTAFWLIMMTILASLSLSMVVARWVKINISEPLSELADGMEKLSKGSLDVTIAPNTRLDELGKLTRSFFMFQRQIRDAVDLTKQLEAQREELLQRGVVLDLVLSTSPVGLAVFNARDELVLNNERYWQSLFDDSSWIRTGITAQDIWTRMVALGRLDSAPNHRNEDGLVGMSIFKFNDGKSCRILRQSAPDGSWVATLEDVTDRVRMDEHIAHMALHDSLTDLPNRAYFTNHLQQILSNNEDRPIAVFFFDLDRFKEVNDTYGHSAGDTLLAHVADRVRGSLKNGEFIARIGGDEFAVFALDLKSEDEIHALAQRITSTVSDPYYFGGATHTVGCSMGIAVSPRDGVSASELIGKADLALYQSKNQGRGVYHFFAPDMVERHERVLAQERDLREALVREQFEVWYQPIYSIDGLELVACEALLRWRHPERGLVSPGEFIPVAERSGLISPIGGWVLKKACADAATWPQDIKVCVNVSVVQLRSAHVNSVVKAALAASGLPPSRLEIEVTESQVLFENEALIHRLEDVRKLGVSLAMDDFGTGHSVLSSLEVFPFDRIKLDRTYVQGLSEGRKTASAVIRAVAAMAQDLTVESVAEGIETAEELAMVRALGISHVQGFLLARPMPQAEFQARLAELRRHSALSIEVEAFERSLKGTAAA